MTIPVGFAQITYQYLSTAYPLGAAWTIGCDPTGALSPDDVAALALAEHTQHLSAVQNVATTLTGVLVKFGPDATGPSSQVAATVPGTVNDPASPAGVAVLIRKNTALGGRRGRGRIYFPGIWDGAVSAGGTVASGTVDAIQLAINSWNNELRIGLGGDLVLLHADLTTPTVISSFSVQSTVATQRRRQRR